MRKTSYNKKNSIKYFFIPRIGIITAIEKYDVQTRLEEMKMEDFLFDGLPVVRHKGKYIIFSYYSGKILAINEEKFDEEEVKKF